MRTSPHTLTLAWLLAPAMVFVVHSSCLAVQVPQKAAVKLMVTGNRVDYFSDEKVIQAHGAARVELSNGVTIEGDVVSVDLSLRRFVVAGHVRLLTPQVVYTGAAFADFVSYHRAYFIPLTDIPDRWTFIGDNWTTPEKGREMPGDAFFLTDMGAAKPFITGKSVVIDPDTYSTFVPVAFRLLDGALTLPPLPLYVRNFSSNPNFGVNSLAGASVDIPYGIAGSSASLDAIHLRYDQVRNTYASFEHHSVFGDYGYAVFSLNPATQEQKQWNLLSYIPTTARSSLILDAQLFTFQSGLSQPLSSNGFLDMQVTNALRESALTIEGTQAYDSFLAQPPLGYYGNPTHPWQPNHPITGGLAWNGFTQHVGNSGFTIRLLSGASAAHDHYGIDANPQQDVQTVYVGGTLGTPVVRAPFGTSLYGTYSAQHVWLSYPNSADFQLATLADSKQFSNTLFVTASVELQSAVTKNLAQTLITPNASTGMIPQPQSPNGFPLVGGIVTEFPHVTNTSIGLTAAYAPSANFQLTISAVENNYTPLQEPFVAGPPRYIASADARMRISKTLFLDIGRSYFFNWANQLWSPNFSFHISAQ